MAILIDRESRIIVQGITGHTGGAVARRLRQAGGPIVGGVTPGRGGGQAHGLPIFDSCAEAVAATGAGASFIAVPAPHLMDACFEAIDAGIKIMTAYTEGVAIADTIRIAAYARARGAVVIGPNAAGCVSAGRANISDLNDDFITAGPVGVVSKSGAASYEVIRFLAACGLGVSTVVCLGGDPVMASDHRDILERFAADPETRAVVLVGEIGGHSENLAAPVIPAMGKPVIAHILGSTAPAGRAMGHAGALLGGADENAPGKIAALRLAGAIIADQITEIGRLTRQALERG
jgi:succinyl-CoA synthetase alpha subunit